MISNNDQDQQIWTEQALRDPHAPDGKSEKVRRTFDAIAGRYDRVNTLISFGLASRWRRQLVRMMGDRKKPMADILDLCCGTGAMVRPLRSAFPEANLVGLDFSLNMLSLAQKKQRAFCRNWIGGDGMAIPFGEERFDGVSCVFGLRNYESPTRGLAEIHRVLRRGGVLAVLDFQLPQGRLIAPVFRFYFEQILPMVGSVASGDRKIGAYQYLPQSVRHWYDITQVLDFMRASGLRPIQVKSMCFGSVWAIMAEK